MNHFQYKCILIDPHNFDRSSDFYAQQFVDAFVANRKHFALKTQNLAGKKDTYRGCYGVTELEMDFNVEMLKNSLSIQRADEPLTVEVLSNKISVLGCTLEKCSAILEAE